MVVPAFDGTKGREWMATDAPDHQCVRSDLGRGFGPLDAELGGERLGRGSGVSLVLGVVYLGQCLLGGRVSRLRESGEDIAELVDLMPTSA